MRQTSVDLNVSRHHRARGQVLGVKVEMGVTHFPMGLLQVMINTPLQWKLWWGGPAALERPTLRVLWGWLPEEGWTQGYAYLRRSAVASRGGKASRLKFTASQTATRFHTGQSVVPLGRWSGTLTAEPDEESPTRIGITVRPNIYLPRVPFRPEPIAPAPNTDLPTLVLP